MWLLTQGWKLCNYILMAKQNDKVTTTVYIPLKTHKKIKVAAAQRMISVSQLIEEAVDCYLKQPKTQE